jgi:uncharacterized protein YdeI (YjbR/CyaY-like superfamily)
MPIEVTEIFYPKNRQEWRNWLIENGQTKTEIWVETYIKASGMPCITYDELVEESLCFGWIDGSVKKNAPESSVQRVTPRRKKTFLSELNRQRIWKLQAQGLMTPLGIAPIAEQIGSPDDPFTIPDWIEAQLKADPQVWENFQGFPHLYKRLKVSWVLECGPSRKDESIKRLNYLIKMTRQGKKYGTIPLGA